MAKLTIISTGRSYGRSFQTRGSFAEGCIPTPGLFTEQAGGTWELLPIFGAFCGLLVASGPQLEPMPCRDLRNYLPPERFANYAFPCVVLWPKLLRRSTRAGRNNLPGGAPRTKSVDSPTPGVQDWVAPACMVTMRGCVAYFVAGF